MVARAMIAFAVILPDKLPVPSLNDGRAARDLGIAEIMLGEIRLDRLTECVKIGRHIGKTDIDEPGDRATMNGLEAMLRRVKILTHVPRPEKLATQVIGPTDDRDRSDWPRALALPRR